MHFTALTLAFTGGLALARNVPGIVHRDEWQPPVTCFYLTTDIDWKGHAENMCQAPSYCVNTLEPEFSGNISSAGPDEGQVCFLYAQQNCTGARSVPIMYPGYANLGDGGVNFNDQARSFRCWSLCGYLDGSLPSQAVTSNQTISTASSTQQIPITSTAAGNTTQAIPTASSTQQYPITSTAASNATQASKVTITVNLGPSRV